MCLNEIKSLLTANIRNFYEFSFIPFKFSSLTIVKTAKMSINGGQANLNIRKWTTIKSYLHQLPDVNKCNHNNPWMLKECLEEGEGVSVFPLFKNHVIVTHYKVPSTAIYLWIMQNSQSFKGLTLAFFSVCRFFEHGRPGSQRKLRTARSNPGPALDERKHCVLWGRPFTHYCFWVWGRGLVRQPPDSFPLFWR